jgi:Polyketide cyclase / dehydrase and lipid transport
VAVELTVSVEVDAPPEVVFDAAVDWERQGEWVALTTVSGIHGLGGTLVARTAVGPFGFDDPMSIETWDPPWRCVVRHHGRVVRGSAAFEVQALGENRSRFVWTEWLVMPMGLFGELGFQLVKPLVMAALRWSLRRFARFAVSTRGTSGSPSRGTT